MCRWQMPYKDIPVHVINYKEAAPTIGPISQSGQSGQSAVIKGFHAAFTFEPLPFRWRPPPTAYHAPTQRSRNWEWGGHLYSFYPIRPSIRQPSLHATGFASGAISTLTEQPKSRIALAEVIVINDGIGSQA